MYRETEMSDGLDTVEKQCIKKLAQKLREELKNEKKDDFKPSLMAAGLGKIPKIPKLDERKKEEAGPSFEDLMFMMDAPSANTPIKALPIKNKNRDLIAS